MKEGFVIKNVNKELGYFGIDACNPNDEPWPYLNEWNTEYSNEPISLKEGNKVFTEGYTPDLLRYLKWLKINKAIDTPCLFWFSTLRQDSNNERFLNQFYFVGYDCVYIEDEFSESILFSTIFNEMHSINNITFFSSYFDHLNQYGLFDDDKLANQYLNFRNEMIAKDEGNLETAWKNLSPFLVKVFCYGNG